MKHALWMLLVIASLVIAQDHPLVAEHDKYLLETGNTAMIPGHCIFIVLQDGCPNCPPESKIHVSVRVMDNKYSALVQLGQKRLHEGGILNLQKDKPGFRSDIKMFDKEALFGILYLFGEEKKVAVRENLSKVFPHFPAEEVLTKVGERILPTIEKNLNTNHFEPCIMDFLQAQRHFFGMLLQPDHYILTHDRSLHCPRCGDNCYHFSDYCFNCQKCITMVSWKCPECWKSASAGNGKVCNTCGQCYR